MLLSRLARRIIEGSTAETPVPFRIMFNRISGMSCESFSFSF